MPDYIWIVILVLLISFWGGTGIYYWTLPSKGKKAFAEGFWNMFGLK